jgi:hypothetical protein
MVLLQVICLTIAVWAKDSGRFTAVLYRPVIPSGIRLDNRLLGAVFKLVLLSTGTTLEDCFPSIYPRNRNVDQSRSAIGAVPFHEGVVQLRESLLITSLYLQSVEVLFRPAEVVFGCDLA